MIKRPRVRIIAELIGLSATLVIAVCYRDELKDVTSKISTIPLVLSVVLALAANVILAVWYRGFLDKNGTQASFGMVFGVFLLGNISKYVPGKIASFIHQYMLFGSEVPLSVVTIVNLELLMLTIGITTLVSFALMSVGYSMLLMLPAVLLIYLYSVWMKRQSVLLWIMKRFGSAGNWMPNRKEIRTELRWGFAGVGFALVYVLAHALILSQMVATDMTDLLLLVGLFGLSWIIGTLAIVFPGGIGIREFSFLALGSAFSGTAAIPDLAGIAIALRVWQVLYELTGALIGLAVIKYPSDPS